MDKELEEAKQILCKYINFNEVCGTRNFKNAIETLVQAVENSIPKSVVEEKIKEMERMSKLAEKCINQKTIIADSDSLHYGEKIAHKTDANILRELL